MPLDRGDHLARVVARQHHQRGARIGRGVQAGVEGEAVEQRHDAEDAFRPRLVRHQRLALADVGRHLAVGAVGALRQTGGAAGVLKRRPILGARKRPGQIGRGAVAPDVEAAPTVAAGDERVAEAETGADAGHRFRDPGIDDRRMRRGVAENVADLALGIDRIDRNRLRAGRMHREHGHRHLQRVAEQQRDPAAARAGGDQLVRQPADAADILGIGEAAGAVDQRDMVRRRCDGRGQHVDDGRMDGRQVSRHRHGSYGRRGRGLYAEVSIRIASGEGFGGAPGRAVQRPPAASRRRGCGAISAVSSNSAANWSTMAPASCSASTIVTARR